MDVRRRHGRDRQILNADHIGIINQGDGRTVNVVTRTGSAAGKTQYPGRSGNRCGNGNRLD